MYVRMQITIILNCYNYIFLELVVPLNPKHHKYASATSISRIKLSRM